MASTTHKIMVEVTVTGKDDYAATPGDVAAALEYAVTNMGPVLVDVCTDQTDRLEGWMVDAAMVVRH